MDQQITIDLGEIGREPTPHPSPKRARHPRFRAGLAAVAVLALTGASAPPAPPALVESRVEAAPGDSVHVVGDRFYVLGADPGLTGGRPRTIAAYDLPGARPLWRRPTPMGGAVRWMMGAKGRLFVLIESPAGTLLTAALDPDTGGLLWQHEARMSGVVAATGQVLLRRPATGPGGLFGAQVLEAVDPASGRTVWSHEVPGDGFEFVADAAASRSVTGLRSGRVEVRDLITGRVVAARALWRPPVPAPPPEEWLLVAGDLVLVAADPRGTVAAYSLETLQLRWTARLDLSDSYAARCGDALCILGWRGSGLRLVDPGTGRTRWVSPDWEFAEEVGGRLLAFSGEPAGETSIAVLDAATGHRVLDLGPWNRAGPVEADGRMMLIQQPPGADRAWLAVFDTAALTVQALGSVPAVPGACQTAPGVVICRRPGGAIGVWRYR